MTQSLASPGRFSASSPSCILLRLRNLAQLNGYGDEGVQRALDHAERIAASKVQSWKVTRSLDGLLFNRDLVARPGLDAKARHEDVEEVAMVAERIALTPFLLDGRHILFVPEVVPCGGEPEVHAIMRTARAPADAEGGDSLAELETIGAMLGLNASGEVPLCWQEVASIRRASTSLYFHASPSVDLAAGGWIEIDDLLVQSGLARALEHAVFRQVLSELASAPHVVLGATVSASGAVLDLWWQGIIARLEDDRGLAERLAVEVRAPRGRPTPASWFAFVRRLQACGCRVVLGQFGVSGISISDLAQWRPDQIQLGGAMASFALKDETSEAILEGLVDLARAISPTVSLGGVDGPQQLLLAERLGIEWAQGLGVSPPSHCRPWRRHGHRA